MKAAVIERPHQIRVREVPDLIPDEFQALVQILACSICNGTDLKLLHGQFPGISGEAYPGILGHEAVGRVIRLGRRVKYFKEGDMVFRPGAVYPQGLSDRVNTFWGGLAECGLVTDARAVLEEEPTRSVSATSAMQQIVPDWMGPVDATMCITFKETLSWLQKFGVTWDMSLLIMGTGPVGLSFTRFAKILGASPVIVLGRRKSRLDLAEKLGADHTIDASEEDPVARCKELTDGLGVQKAVEAVGDDALIEVGLRCLANAGSLGIYGISPAPGGSVMERRITLSGLPGEWSLAQIQPAESNTHVQVIDAVRLGLVDPRDFYSDVLSLDEVPQAFKLLEEKRALKVVIRITV